MIFPMNTRTLIAGLLAAGLALSSFVHAAEPKGAEGAKRASPVAVGDVAPDFTLEDQVGHKHTLSAERGKRPVILVFYRGYW